MAAVAAYLKGLVLSLATVLRKGRSGAGKGRRRGDGKEKGSLLRTHERPSGLV